MAKNSDLGVSPDDKAHQDVMRSIAEKMADTSYGLKGGTALLLTRGLDRHSVDLDFDATKGVNMEGRIKASFKETGLDIESLNIKKDTASKQRYMVHYANPATSNENTLKIETGIGLDIDPQTVETVDGIKTYNVSTLYGQKLDAMQGEKPRSAVRDLYDIGFLLKNHGDKLTPQQVKQTADIHADMDGLADRYKASHTADPLLIHVELDALILENRETVDKLANGLEKKHFADIRFRKD